MNITKLTSLFLILAIVLIFVSILFIYQIKSKDKYPGLRFVIISSILQFIAILAFFFAVQSTINILKFILFLIAYLALLSGYITFARALTLLLDKKLIKNFNVYAIILTIVIVTVGLIFRDNNIVFIIIISTTVLIYIIAILTIINYNYTLQQKLKLLPYTIINLIPLVYLIIAFTQNIIIQGRPFEVIASYEGDSILLKTIGIALSSNTVGIVSIINNINFSLINLEDESFNQLFNSVPNIVIVIDPKTNLIKYTNKAFTKQLGYSKKQVLDKFTLDDLIKDTNSIQDFTNNNTKDIYTIKTKDSLEYHVTINKTKVQFDHKLLSVLIINDISELYSKQNKLQKLAYYDELTGLPNRRVLFDKFHEKIKLENRFTVVIFDLDNFKKINDTYGHLIGDQFLIHTANILKPYIKDNDIASRFGGDEFILLISTKDEQDATLKVKELMHKFTIPFKINDLTIKIDASFGFSCFPIHGQSLTALIEKADNALYEAKKTNGTQSKRFSE